MCTGTSRARIEAAVTNCNDDDRRPRRKQGGVVGAAASRMRGPPKGRNRRWEPQPGFLSNPAAEIEKDRHTNVYRSFSVGAAGFEPTASSSRTRRATNCAMPRKYRSPLGCGLVGDERIELPQVESESTALPLCKSPLFGFALSTEAPLTKNIIQPPPPFVNHFF